MGSRRIAIVTGPLTLKNERRRLLGYKRALEHNGLPVENELIWQGNLRPEDLALLEDFHTMGRIATAHLASMAGITPGDEILDAGSGIGGTARYVAERSRCHVTAVDLTVALCVTISAERVSSLGTMLRGPQRLRHRGWEDWWGWESNLAGLHPQFFDLSPLEQEDAVAAWFAAGLEWLVGSGLLQRRAAS